MPNGSLPVVARAILISLGIVMVGLLFALVIINNQHVAEYQSALDTIEVDEKLIKETQTRFQKTSATLQKTTAEFATYRSKAETDIATLTAERDTTRTQLANTSQKLMETASKLKTVESQKDELQATLDTLQKDIEGYTTQIAGLKDKLKTETKDKEFLLAQLKDLEGKRAALEKQWNDLAQLKQQVRTIVTAQRIRNREELAEKRGYFGAFQNAGLRNYKTYAEVEKERGEKITGTTVIEVHRENPVPAAPPAPQPKQLPAGEQPKPPQ